jgi:molecular chaperone Hsp33
MPEKDFLIRATAAEGAVRAFAATTRTTVQEAHDRHRTSPVVTAALGRLMTAALMMGAMLKNDEDAVSLIIHSDGPMQGATVTANRAGQVKGFAKQTDIWLPLRPDGHLPVGDAVGKGTLTVIRDQPDGLPYSGQIELVDGEIADDVTRYFAVSDQIPSSVGLGVLVDTDQSVRQAGGFIVQLMPGCPDEVIDRLEANLKGLSSVTEMLEKGLDPRRMLESVLDGLDVRVLDEQPVAFHCNCSRQRVAGLLKSLGKDELQAMLNDDEPVEVQCHFCGEKYRFSDQEVQTMIAED